MVPRQPGGQPPPGYRGHRRQLDHRGLVRVLLLDRTAAQPAVLTHRFGASLRRDYDAVLNGLLFWCYRQVAHWLHHDAPGRIEHLRHDKFSGRSDAGWVARPCALIQVSSN